MLEVGHPKSEVDPLAAAAALRLRSPLGGNRLLNQGEAAAHRRSSFVEEVATFAAAAAAVAVVAQLEGEVVAAVGFDCRL